MIGGLSAAWVRLACRLFSWAFLGLLAAAFPGLAQKPRVETFTLDDGLPSSVIFDLAQDRGGRLWILTRLGVTVYDGLDFRSYTTAEGLPSGLGALTIDARDRVWTVALWSEARVFRLDDDVWTSLPSAPSEVTSTESPPSLAVLARDGRTLVAAAVLGSGLWVWDGTDDGAARHAVGELPSEMILGLEAVGDRIAVATGKGLCFLSLDAELDCSPGKEEPWLRRPIFGLHAVEEPGRPPQVWLLSQGPGHDYGSPASLACLEDGRLTVVATEEELPRFPRGRRNLVALDAAGGIYLGGAGVVYYLDPGSRTVTPIGLREGLASDGASAFLLDRESNLWVGSHRGLSRIGTRRFLSLDASQGLFEDEVTAVLEVAPGRFLLGHNDGLTFLGGREPETMTLSRELGGQPDAYRILSLLLDRDGFVWMVTTGAGLLRLDPSRRVRGGWLEGVIPALTLDVEGHVWTVDRRYLYRLDGEGFSRVHDSFGAMYVRALEVSGDGRVFLATTSGLQVLEQGLWTQVTAPDPAANNAFALSQRPSGEVWVGTGAGLYERRGEELKKADSPSIDNPVYFILSGGDGRTWFGTDDGVLVWDGADLRRLSLRQGLISRETNRGAGFVDHRGRIWIGTDKGVSIYEKRYDRALPAPRIELESVTAGGDVYPPDSGLRLGYGEHRLDFRIRVIAFSREEELQVRYYLEGHDEGPREPEPLKSSEIRFLNLPPGTYRLHVAAGWAGGAWSEELTSAAIVVPRPFWKSFWFYAFLALAGAGVYALRVRAVRRRTRELEGMNRKLYEAAEERERLIRDLESKNAELERFTYTVSHDLKTPLVTIRGFLGYLKEDRRAGDFERMDRDVERIEDAATKMGDLLAELLELSRIGRVVNPSEEISLGELAREVVELSEARLRQSGATVEIAEDLPSVFGDRPRLREVMQNLVENAVKFSGPEPKPRIEIGVRHDASGGETVAFVRDNGIGIDPRYREQVFGLFDRLDHEKEGTGVGLALVRRIVEFHGGRVWAESEGTGKGSTFCVVLPWSKS